MFMTPLANDGLTDCDGILRAIANLQLVAKSEPFQQLRSCGNTIMEPAQGFPAVGRSDTITCKGASQ